MLLTYRRRNFNLSVRPLINIKQHGEYAAWQLRCGYECDKKYLNVIIHVCIWVSATENVIANK